MPSKTERQGKGRKILDRIRTEIRRVAKGTANMEFYYNRFILQRLKAGEDLKKEIKTELLIYIHSCCFCQRTFSERLRKTGKGIDVHRTSEGRYLHPSRCRLAHTKCHNKHHALKGNSSDPQKDLDLPRFCDVNWIYTSDYRLNERPKRDALTMQGVEHNGHEELTILELVLQLQGDFRKSLEPIRVTPLQAGVILFLCRHAEAKVTDAAALLHVSLPTLSDVVKDLVRKRWITRRRSVMDTRVVHLSLSRRGRVITRKIENQVRRVSTGVAANKVVTAAGLTWLHRAPAQLKEASS